MQYIHVGVDPTRVPLPFFVKASIMYPAEGDNFYFKIIPVPQHFFMFSVEEVSFQTQYQTGNYCDIYSHIIHYWLMLILINVISSPTLWYLQMDLPLQCISA